MPEIPFVFEWTIAESQLLPLKDSVNGFLFSTSISDIPEFEYNFSIYPNGNSNEFRGRTILFLHLKFKNVKKVEADYTFTIQTANFLKPHHKIFNETYGWGTCICKTEEFFNPEKKFIVVEEFVIKVYGVFKFESANIVADIVKEKKCEGGELGDELWARNDSKDFAIITADGKEIKAHKFILENRSDVFKNMVNLNFQESKENHINEKKDGIPYFSFNVVETALKIIYTCHFDISLSFNDLISLLYFFDKYSFSTFKAKIELLLIEKISASTICRLTNCSILTNSSKLKKKCIKFLIVASESKIPMYDIDYLDKDMALEILENFLYHKASFDCTENEQQQQQKWEGGELGDELWKNDEIKDFTIITSDGKEIKFHKLIVGTRSPTLNEIFKMKEVNEVEIIDFSYNVVETAIKLIYLCNFTTSLTMDELMELLQFFDKYNLQSLMDKVEPLLINQISASSVCRLTNCSIQTNSPKLKEKCIEFLSTVFKSKTSLADIHDLDNNIALELLQNFFVAATQQ